MANHYAQTSGRSGLEHPPAGQASTLLHDLELYDIGATRPDHVDQAGVVGDRLVGHDGDADRAPDLRHPFQVVSRDGLFEQLKIEWLQQFSQSDAILDAVP